MKVGVEKLLHKSIRCMLLPLHIDGLLWQCILALQSVRVAQTSILLLVVSSYHSYTKC